MDGTSGYMLSTMPMLSGETPMGCRPAVLGPARLLKFT